MKNTLIIGGTGIIGSPLSKKLVEDGYEIYLIALEKSSDLFFAQNNVTEIVVDRYSDEYKREIQALHKTIDQWDAVVDICAFDDKAAQQTHELFKDHAQHIISISTTLVYDRRHEISEVISELTPLAPEGVFGGYVDGKLRLEKYWQSVEDVSWTILRPYHVLGRHSLLGCIPAHNRDPLLLERIKNNETLHLVNAGDVNFSYVHPEDIAQVICKLIGNEQAFGQAYNVVNPEIINAREYYQEIAWQLDRELKIETVSMNDVWNNQKTWEMATLPHPYSVDKLQSAIGYIPNTPIQKAITDAIGTYPIEQKPISEIPVHRNMNLLPRPQRPEWL